MLHTPGPWSQRYEPDVEVSGNLYVVHDSEGYGVAFVSAWDAPEPGQVGAPEEAKANANLINAAPELLVAAEEALRRLESFMRVVDREWDGIGKPGSTIYKLRTSIAKARGTPSLQGACVPPGNDTSTSVGRGGDR